MQPPHFSYKGGFLATVSTDRGQPSNYLKGSCKDEGKKHFTVLWGLNCSQRYLRRSIPPLSWLPALFPCPGAVSSLLMVGLKSDGELGAWCPWKAPNTHESRQAHGLGTSLLWEKSEGSRESLELIAGGHGSSGGGWTEMIPCLGRKGDPSSSPKSLIPTRSGTRVLHGKALFLSKHCNPARCLSPRLQGALKHVEEGKQRVPSRTSSVTEL